MFIIEEAIDVKDAEQTKEALLAAVDLHSEGEFLFDLSGTAPSQIALQISLAALKEIKARGFEPLPGPALTHILQNEVSTLKAG